MKKNPTLHEVPKIDHVQDMVLRSCEIYKAQFCEPATTPDPMAKNGVYDQTCKEAVGQVSLEVCPFGHKTRRDRGRCRAKRKLKEEKGQGRDSESWKNHRDALQGEPFGAKKGITGTKHQAKTQDDESNSGHRCIH